MKVLSVVLIICGLLSGGDAVNCYTGADAAAATTAGSADCGDVNIVKCKMPKWSYAGYASGTTWGCGACDVSETATCQDCGTGTGTNDCNAPYTLADSFQCYSWSYSGSAWVKASTVTTCQRKDGEDIMCNAPDRDVDSSTTGYNVQNDGCGACETNEKSNGACLECTTTKCNGSTAATVSAFLAALVALICAM